MKFGLALLLVLGAALPAPGDPDLDSLVKQLADDDSAVREKATAALLALGADSRGKLEAVLEETNDPEVRERLTNVIREYDRRTRWTEQLEKDPASLALDRVAGETCPFCGNQKPWSVSEFSREFVKRHFANCRIIEFDWHCCQDHPVPSRFFLLGPTPDDAFEIGGADWMVKIRSHVMPAKDADEARLRLAAVLSFEDVIMQDDTPEVKTKRRFEEITAEKGADGGVTATMAYTGLRYDATFDAEGNFLELQESAKGR